MPEAKRPDPRRRSTADARAKKASRPGRPGDAGRGKPRANKEIAKVGDRPDATEVPTGSDAAVGGEDVVLGDSIRDSIAAAAERAAEQRFGSAARRAAILAAVICVLTLTIAGPVRTYFGQRTEMMQIKASEAKLREQIAELEQQKDKLADPVFIASQARERLGFVMPGEIPYQVQLPPGAAVPGADSDVATPITKGDPWYTALWHTIAEAPQGISPAVPQSPPGTAVPVPPTAPAPGG
ncbi:MAG: septum formation initiator family protein [Actinomycetia bacterium]|nr:septum formation initiator family protein [Actinomycetes bacterium]